MVDQPGVSQNGRADVGKGRLFYETRGTGGPLVLVHGGLLGRKLWDPMMASLSRRYRLYRYDQRGYGESDRPKGVYSYWEDLLKLTDAWSLPSAIFVGFAEGAATVIDFALAAPQRVNALVLISPYLHGYEYSPTFQADLAGLGDAYLSMGAPAVADILMRNSHYSPPHNLMDERKRLRELILENAHVLAFNWMQLRPLDPLAAGRLNDVAAPTLVVSGPRDSIDNLNVADRLRYRIPGAEFVSIAGAGHVLPVEAPVMLMEALNEFLSRVIPGG